MRNVTPMSNEQIQAVAPSAFAIRPYEKQSSRYAFVPTSEIITAMRGTGFEPYSAAQSRTRIEGKSEFTKHMIRFRNPNAQLSQVGDNAVEVILVNSHDGTSAYDLSLGMFRLACLNGLIVAESLVESIHVRHVGNIVQEVLESSTKLIERAPEVLETVNQWKSLMLTDGEQKILAEEAASVRFDGESPVEAARLLTVRRQADSENDLWSVFNRIQENTVRGGLKFRNEETGRRNRTRQVKGIDQNIRLNRALWSLAEKMAALKAAPAVVIA